MSALFSLTLIHIAPEPHQLKGGSPAISTFHAHGLTYHDLRGGEAGAWFARIEAKRGERLSEWLAAYRILNLRKGESAAKSSGNYLLFLKRTA